MGEDKVIRLKSSGTPGAVEDPLTEVWREGARRLLVSAIEAEVESFLEQFREEKTTEGLNRMVRNGRLPSRTIQTGIGDIEVSVPRVRDRAGKVRFSSSILPPYLRRTKTVEGLLPWLYLKGISTGEFQEALTVLLGKDAPGLSASTISRLKESWKEEHRRWARRDLSNRHYVYLWVDGIHFGVRMEDAAQCVLVVIGATADGKKVLSVYRPKYPKAVACLEKDRDALLTFYDFPAEHWIHLRTTNPIESTFATVRLRTARTRGCVSRESILAMVFMLVKSAERHWRKLNGIPRLAQVIEGVVFKDGVREDAEKIAA
ncbi:transposase [Candidatus Methylocalor cossyra]